MAESFCGKGIAVCSRAGYIRYVVFIRLCNFCLDNNNDNPGNYFSSLISSDFANTKSNTSGAFTQVEDSLISHNIKPIGSIINLSVSYEGAAQVAENIHVVSSNYPDGVDIDGGVFFAAFEMSSPGTDNLLSRRYYIN